MRVSGRLSARTRTPGLRPRTSTRRVAVAAARSASLPGMGETARVRANRLSGGRRRMTLARLPFQLPGGTRSKEAPVGKLAKGGPAGHAVRWAAPHVAQTIHWCRSRRYRCDYAERPPAAPELGHAYALRGECQTRFTGASACSRPWRERAQLSGERANEGGSVGRPAVCREYDLDRQLEQHL